MKNDNLIFCVGCLLTGFIIGAVTDSLLCKKDTKGNQDSCREKELKPNPNPKYVTIQSSKPEEKEVINITPAFWHDDLVIFKSLASARKLMVALRDEMARNGIVHCCNYYELCGITPPFDAYMMHWTNIDSMHEEKFLDEEGKRRYRVVMPYPIITKKEVTKNA